MIDVTHLVTPTPLPSLSRCGPGRMKDVQIKPGWETQMPHRLALSSTFSPGPGFLSLLGLGGRKEEGKGEFVLQMKAKFS